MVAAVVSTGTANTASVLGWLGRAGLAPRLTANPRDVADASLVILPGVGTLGAAMRQLASTNLVEPLRARALAGRPLLAICLGMQLLFDSSDESPGARGLGVIPGVIRRLPAGARVPNMGWCNVVAARTCSAIPSGTAYFANSFACLEPPHSWACARTGPFISAVQRSGVLGCQFHPELSGSYGHRLLDHWLDRTGRPPQLDSLVTRPRPLPRIIPCLDVRGGRVVKGVRFADLRDAGDPVEAAAAYQQQGADEIVILDVSATPEQRATAAATVRAVRAVLSIPLTVGGGVRSAHDARTLLSAGADKVAINTAAVADPSLVATLAEEFGSQCTVVAIDAARRGASWDVVTRSGTDRTALDAIAWAVRAASLGAGELLLTSVDRDGTGHGYDLELLRAVRSAVSIPVIASGGASSPDDLADALAAGADAALAASIFHDARFTVGDVKSVLASRGLETRP